MTYRSNVGGVQAPSFFDRFVQFEYSLEHRRIGISAIPQSQLHLMNCPICHERCFRIRHHGEAIFIVAGAKVWEIHQCPPQHYDLGPEEGQDEPQRDGDGELV